MKQNGLPGITKKQMIEVDRIMMDELHVPIDVMMEHAGLSLARLSTLFLEKRKQAFHLVAGTGNNGGGGLVASQRLARWGYDVHAFLTRGVESLRNVPKLQLRRAKAAGVKVHEGLPDPDSKRDEEIVLDAYLGYGYMKREDSVTEQVFNYLAEHNHVISLDSPSGLDITTGENDSGIKPKATLTIAFAKIGLLSAPNEAIGKLYVCDIGIPSYVYRERLGIKWSPPRDQTELTRLYKAFQKDSLQKVTIVYNDVSNEHLWLI